MVELGPGQQAVVMPHYPHMMAEDREVWTKFLEAGRPAVERVWYDVRVGLGVLLGPEVSELERRVAAGVTRKRIDVVAKVGGGYWVVEVKPVANMAALGQVVTYRRLFVGEYRVDGEVFGVVVCDEVDEDVVGGYEELGVLVLRNG